MFILFSTIISFVIGFVGGLIEFPWIGNIYSLAVLLPSIAVAIRRMHDLNKSGWYILIPIYNIILCATEGDTGTNEYGPDPKNEGADLDEISEFGQKEADVNMEA